MCYLRDGIKASVFLLENLITNAVKPFQQWRGLTYALFPIRLMFDMPHSHLTHDLDHRGICQNCGCPQFGAVRKHLACPVTDAEFKNIWEEVEQYHGDVYKQAKRDCTAARIVAIKRQKAEKKLARSAKSSAKKN